MRIVRRNTFETNSSSTHSLTMCTKDDYEKWKNGELVYDRWDDGLINPTEQLPDEDQYYDKQYQTPEEFFNNPYYETFKEEFTTPNGEEVIAFGYYGYDG